MATSAILRAAHHARAFGLSDPDAAVRKPAVQRHSGDAKSCGVSARVGSCEGQPNGFQLAAGSCAHTNCVTLQILAPCCSNGVLLPSTR